MGSKKIVLEFFAILVSTMCVVPAEGIDCYQCVSTNNAHPFQCNEFLSSDIDMEPTSCDEVFGAQYCVKHVGRFEDGVGTKRFCSAVHMGNYCEYVKHSGDQLEYRTCVYTCDSHGCNPASTIKLNSATIIFSSLSLISLILWR